MIPKNTVILTVHNKQDTITQILSALVRTLSADTKRIIIVLDGCTDGSQNKIASFIDAAPQRFEFHIITANDVWETKANNIGLRMVKSKYATIMQDDMLVKEPNWDRKLLNIFDKIEVFAVTGRTAHDFSFENGFFKPVNLVGREYPFGSIKLIPRAIAKLMSRLNCYWLYRFISPVAVRTTVNRGPMIINFEKARELDFFDESFAPFELDDVDLCCRAHKRYGLRSASKPIYYIEIAGSKANNVNSSEMSRRAIEKNSRLLMERHEDMAVKA